MTKFITHEEYLFLQTERGEINKRKADDASSRNLQPWFLDRLSDIHYTHYGTIVNQNCRACVSQAFHHIHDLLEAYEAEQIRIQKEIKYKAPGRTAKPWNVPKETKVNEKAN